MKFIKNDFIGNFEKSKKLLSEYIEIEKEKFFPYSDDFIQEIIIPSLEELWEKYKNFEFNIYEKDLGNENFERFFIINSKFDNIQIIINFSEIDNLKIYSF